MENHALYRWCSCVVTCLLVWVMCACVGFRTVETTPGFSLLSKAGAFRAETPSLALECSKTLQFRVLYKKQGSWITLSPKRDLPSGISAELGDHQAISFTLRSVPSHYQTVTTAFGEARQISVAAADSAGIVGLSLDLIFPKDFTDTVILESRFKNSQSSRPITISEITEARIRLLPGDHAGPEDIRFWSLQGGGYAWGKDWMIPVRADFSQDNYTGPKGNGDGGGTPIVDLWRPDMGVAMALLDPRPVLAWLPVSTDHLGRAEAKVVTRPLATIAPGADYAAPPVMIVAHERDFYDAVARYREVMDRLGVHVRHDYVPGDFAPAWCTWGLKRKFTVPQLLEKLPQMKAMGIKDFIIDDGWFDNFGDWEPTRQKFPRGEADMKALIKKVHAEGLSFRLWWSPGSVDPGSNIDKGHPDWYILDKTGHREKAAWNACYICPAYAPARAYTRALVTRFVKAWSVDAFKLDGDDLNHAPLCYNPAHHHVRPEESFEQWPLMFQDIRETAQAIHKDFRAEFCPCGITPTFQMSAIFEQPTDSDPYDYQVTSRVKFLKALLGPHSPVLQEYVGLKGFYDVPYLEARLKHRVDLYARGIGTGEVPSTFSPVLAKPHADWTAIYNTYRPAEGEYLNLYDIRWETPEGHVIRKEDKLFYGFFTETPGESFAGTVHLRGLDKARHYEVKDYVANRGLGEVSGPVADIPVKFQDGLLLVATPAP